MAVGPSGLLGRRVPVEGDGQLQRSEPQTQHPCMACSRALGLKLKIPGLG